MKNQPKIYNYKTIDTVAARLHDDLSPKDICAVLLYAFNRTGKTRLSMAFKEKGKKKNLLIHCIIMPLRKIFSHGITI